MAARRRRQCIRCPRSLARTFSGAMPALYRCCHDEVLEQMITAAPRRVLVYEPDDLVPKRLTPRETRAMLKGMRDAVELVILTSHVQGSDLILRTLEYLGDRSTPSVPRPPVPPESDPKGSPSACSCVVHGSLLLSPPLSLTRRSRCAVLGCPVVVSRRAGGRPPSLRRSYSPSVRAASNAPKPFGVQARAALRTAERIHSSRRKRLRIAWRCSFPAL